MTRDAFRAPVFIAASVVGHLALLGSLRLLSTQEAPTAVAVGMSAAATSRLHLRALATSDRWADAMDLELTLRPLGKSVRVAARSA